MRALLVVLLLSSCATPRHTTAMVTAGQVLTFVGTAISLTGTAMFLATDNFSGSGPVNTTGLVLAPAAEPIMIAGTVLWVVGLIKAKEQRPPN
jgi:hypothetical protein